MAKRTRRPADDGEFSDPLKDYSPQQFADELERSLSEDSVLDIRHTPATSVEPTTTVEQTIRAMAELDIGSVLITENGKLIGILSERDVVQRIVVQYEHVKDQPIRDFMTPQPVCCYESDPPAKALHLISVHNFRHVPIIDVDQAVTGVLGPKRVTEYLQKHFTPPPA